MLKDLTHMMDTLPPRDIRGDVPLAQNTWEAYKCYQVVKAHKPKTILEIGSQHGGTLQFWMKALVPGGLVISVDLGSEHWAPPQDFNNAHWADWANEAGVNLIALKADSHDITTLQDVKENTPDGIDFLFIDGDHSYQGVKDDFRMYSPLVNHGGIVGLHDLITPKFSPHIQVSKFWRELQAQGYTTREIREGTIWGGIGLVYL